MAETRESYLSRDTDKAHAESAAIGLATASGERVPAVEPGRSAPMDGISPPPAPPTIKRLTFKRDQFDSFLRRARESIEVARWIPKPLRGLFRNQDAFNRELLDAVTSLVKTNNEMANRIADLTTAAEMDAAGAAAIESLQGQLDRLGVHVVNLEEEVDAAGTGKHLQALQEQLDRLGVHVRNLQAEVDTAGAREHLQALQGQVDRLGTHVINVQNEANALRERARSWVDRLRAMERQTERLAVQMQAAQSEVGKSSLETRSAQQSLEHLGSTAKGSRSS